MVKFVTTAGTSYHLEQIIAGAMEEITLISPYLQLTQNFTERLKDADKKGVPISLIYGKTDLKEDQKLVLRQLKHLKLYFSKNLHAKCYMNENSCLISSMNLYEFSERNNREMGIYIEKKGNEALFGDVCMERDSIFNSAELESLSITSESVHREKGMETRVGYCIEYGTSIPYNRDRPFSRQGYYDWQELTDEDTCAPMNFCHFSGEPSEGETSFDYPVLRKNWKKAIEHEMNS